ncbi:MAG: hypothetical protein ACRD6W_05955, partial [Nitrososphaerales archaeon]
MSEATQAARKYVYGHYGELLNVTEPEYDPEKKEWEGELVSYYPRFIQDDAKPGEPWVKFVTLRKLGKIVLDKDLNVLFATPRKSCSDLVEERFSLYAHRAERIMVEASAMNLAGLVDAQHVLAPVIKVVDNLLDREARIPEIRPDDFEDRDNIDRYWDLLEYAKIVTPAQGGGFNSGEEFLNLLQKYRNDYETLLRAVLGLIIKSKYEKLRSVFNMSELEPDIHVDNTYYWPALEADEPIHLKTDSLQERYMAMYDSKVSHGWFVYYLRQL